MLGDNFTQDREPGPMPLQDRWLVAAPAATEHPGPGLRGEQVDSLPGGIEWRTLRTPYADPKLFPRGRSDRGCWPVAAKRQGGDEMACSPTGLKESFRSQLAKGVERHGPRNFKVARKLPGRRKASSCGHSLGQYQFPQALIKLPHKRLGAGAVQRHR